jgi:hypothetical protein
MALIVEGYQPARIGVKDTRGCTVRNDFDPRVMLHI